MLNHTEKSNLGEWFLTPQGRYALDWELPQFDSAVEDCFGYTAAQAGVPSIDFLRNNRAAFRFRFGLEGASDCVADPLQMPFATHSLDLLVLPHVLEFVPDPHHVLREAERVLVPEGHLVLSGFNPFSLWGIKEALTRRGRGGPWGGRFIGLLRLRDWLRLLGFELNGGMFGCYAPPVRQEKWLRRWSFLEKAGERWWPILGGVYVVRAVKRVHGMRMITPAWRRERARRRSIAAVTSRSARPGCARRDGGGVHE